MCRPVSKRLIDSVLQCAGAAGDRYHFSPAKFHLVDVYALTFGIHCAHENLRLHPEQRPNHRRCQAVLAGTGLRDELRFAHVLRQQSLAQGVIDLMSAAMQQVLALDIDLKADVFAETPG